MAALNIMTGVLFPLWALGHCFFGYMLFRVILALNGLAAGFLLGAHVVGIVRQPPTVADVWVAGIIGGILLMLLAWFLYRVIFAGATGLLLAGTVLHCWPAGGTAAWVVAIVVGLVAAGLAFVFLRDLVAVVTAIGGAAAFVVIVVDQWLWQRIPQAWIGQDMPLTIGALIAFILLAAAGMTVQLQTRRRFGKRFGPPTQAPRNTSNTSVRPKFTKV